MKIHIWIAATAVTSARIRYTQFMEQGHFCQIC